VIAESYLGRTFALPFKRLFAKKEHEMSEDRPVVTQRIARMLREVDGARLLEASVAFRATLAALALQANDVRHTRRRLS
jgi:hypothetical protein